MNYLQKYSKLYLWHKFRKTFETNSGMKIFFMALCVFLAAAPAIPQPPPGTSAAPMEADLRNEERIVKLIAQLGAARFEDRQAAEQELKKESRAALSALWKHRESPDPEIAMRVQNIIKHIKANPGAIPEAFFAFDRKPELDLPNKKKAYWDAAMNAWYSNAVVAARNDTAKDTSGTSGSFAQRFVPHTDRIGAIAFPLYIYEQKEGWLRLEVCDDDNGRPGAYVLARVWLLAHRNGLAAPHVFVVFDIPDVEVDPKQTYWFKFEDTQQMTQFVISHQKDVYPEGHLLIYHPDGKILPFSSGSDAMFRIISKCGPVPLLHPATGAELKTLNKDGLPPEKSR
jgi:hypothetical protein